ncbi:hypothetical protein SUDANB120_05919 [Streptomyces sp. enrichment culture]|uniref:hypothetical protein n=1 Tax=Streptomyces TaxID=1883 RepID=UPI00167A691D|nr:MULTISPECIES: hypothetical protein [Streptomyces]MBD3579548.1 hypothetical protein [Streptomyces sp. KD18]GGT23447.1 hypothetical protein GCM10010286_56160 [Streptomyces toxytricini]
MNRRTRPRILVPLAAAALGALLGAGSAAAAPAAPPAATCSISGVLENGRVHLSGGGFTPGPAYVFGSAGFGGTVEIAQNGGFQVMNVPNAEYTVRQGGEVTQCSGFKG